MKYKKLYYTLCLLFLTLSVFANAPIILKDKEETYYATGMYLDIFYDSANTYSISEVSSPAFASRFEKNETVIPRILLKSSGAFWAKFKVINQCPEKVNWLIELFDFEIDHFEIYIPDQTGKFKVLKGGDIYPHTEKEFYHKNFTYEFPAFPDSTEQVCYIKFQSESPMGIIAVIRSVQKFTGYAVTEYYLLAIFYGIALAMLIYNLFLFISIRDRAYLFYVLYVLSTTVYILCHDGTGFQYLWPVSPWLNRYIQPTAAMLMMIWALMYCQSFLSLKNICKEFYTLVNILIVVRIVIFTVTVFTSPELIYVLAFDVFAFMAAYIAGFLALKSGFIPARYYLLAFTFLLAGFIITSMETIGKIQSNIFTVYSLNFGLVAEMLLLSLALADRIKVLMKEKDTAQQQMIQQLKENESLKDKANKELEQKVYERTLELETKNKELDVFVYKASHDIKGPLRSVIGLTLVGLKDTKDPSAAAYFEHILKSTTRLDGLLADLLQLTKVKQVVLQNQEIHFKQIIEEILLSFEHLPRFCDMNVMINVKQPEPFYSDKTMIYSVIQNLIENPIKYCRQDEIAPELKIEAEFEGKKAVLKFTDNGIGISKELQDKIFDMFYKVDSSSLGSGLGLYIVKLCIEKLNGKITVESEPEKGSVFTVTIHSLDAPANIDLFSDLQDK